MKNKRIAEIRESASVTARVLGVIRVITTVCAIIALVSGIICLCTQNVAKDGVIYDNGSFRLLSPVGEEAMINGEGFAFINALHIENFMVWAALNCLVGAGILAVVTVVIALVRRVFVELSDSDTPFNENVRKHLRFTGILVTAVVVPSSLGIAAIVGLSFWCLYCIFGYGVELQKSEDETL